MVEIGLRVVTPFPITDHSNKKSHSQLAYTLDSDLPDVDALGFRNSRWTLDQADLAVIGDSHVYGVNVAAEQNFPSILEAKTGRKVYNFGVSSYGIYQYEVLINEAINQDVKDIIVGLYPANDLALTCKVLGTDYWRSYAQEKELILPDCGPSLGDDPSGMNTIGMLKSFLAKTAMLQAVQELVWRPIGDRAT